VSCLDATFTLTPKSPYWVGPTGSIASLWIHGSDIWALPPSDFSSLYATDRVYFDEIYASDPKRDYSQWQVRLTVPLLETTFFPPAGDHKELILIFGFDALSNGRVLVYSFTERLADQQLLSGDSQFALLIENLDQPFSLYFIPVGGSWFFRGISGYLV
jgi:hypothetical protein